MAVKIDKGNAMGELSLTPLIDIVFLLLIFFLVATKFEEAERQLEVTLPDASEAAPLVDKPNDIVVNINSKGQYYITEKLLDLSDLHKALAQARTDNPSVSAIIRSDRSTVFSYVTDAINAVKRAKITEYVVATQDPNKS